MVNTKPCVLFAIATLTSVAAIPLSPDDRIDALKERIDALNEPEDTLHSQAQHDFAVQEWKEGRSLVVQDAKTSLAHIASITALGGVHEAAKCCMPKFSINIPLFCTLFDKPFAAESLLADSTQQDADTPPRGGDHPLPLPSSTQQDADTPPRGGDHPLPLPGDSTAMVVHDPAQSVHLGTETHADVLFDYNDGDAIPEGLTFLEDYEDSEADVANAVAPIPKEGDDSVHASAVSAEANYGNRCDDNNGWRDRFGDSCAWYKTNTCRKWYDYGQWANCPVTCFMDQPAHVKAAMAVRCHCSAKATLEVNTKVTLDGCLYPTWASMRVDFNVAVKIEGKCFKRFEFTKGKEKKVYSHPAKGEVLAAFTAKQTFEAGIYGWVKPRFQGYATMDTRGGSRNKAQVYQPSYTKDLKIEAKVKGGLTASVVASLGPNFPVVGKVTLGSLGLYAVAENSATMTLRRDSRSQNYRALASVWVSYSAGLALSLGGSFGICGNTLVSFGKNLGASIGGQFRIYYYYVGSNSAAELLTALEAPTKTPSLAAPEKLESATTTMPSDDEEEASRDEADGH